MDRRHREIVGSHATKDSALRIGPPERGANVAHEDGVPKIRHPLVLAASRKTLDCRAQPRVERERARALASHGRGEAEAACGAARRNVGP
jgi:hypothetical protein